MELDQTTFYSVLGLSSNATITEISKSYKKLARKFHPDKSKLADTESIFKIIVEAYTVLSDEALKAKYDEKLMLNGLYDYHLNDKNDSNNPFDVPAYHRRSKPYGEQPYGFGFETNKHDNMKEKGMNKNTFSQAPSNKFKSFNIKSYQRNQRRYSDDVDSTNEGNNINKSERNDNGKQEKKFTKKEQDIDDIDIKSKFSSDTNICKDSNDMESSPDLSFKESGENHVKTNPKAADKHKNEEQFTFDNETPSKKKERDFDCLDGKENIDEFRYIRSKIHKSQNSGKESLNLEQPLPNWDYIQRQHFRVKQKSKEALRRSTSPIKQTSTSENIGINDEWNNSLREIIEKMNNIDQKKVSSTNSTNADAKRKGDFTFDFDNINESLESIPLPSPKRSKTMENDSLLHKPVNNTLPRVYKKEVIYDEETFIHLEILERELPNLPNFQVDLSNPLELENCKEDISRFNSECNNLRRDIMSIYMNRLMFDMENREKLLRIENIHTWLKCRRYDSELINKIQELEYKQSMVAQTFSNMISSIYSSKSTYNL